MCSLYLTHPSAHTPGAHRGAVGGSVPCSRVSPQSNSCRSRDSNPQPRITSPMLYPLGHDCSTYLITSVSSPRLLRFSSLYLQTKYIKHHCLFLFSFKHINIRRNVVQGTFIHYNETKYYIKHCLFSFSF